MMRYSIGPREGIFVKGYGFCSFAKNMGKYINKNLSKNIARNFLIMLNNLPRMHLKLLAQF